MLKRFLSLIAFVIGILVFCTILIFFVSAQIEKQPTGYFVKVESLNVPVDITTTPIGVFVLYDKSKATEVWRENVQLTTYQDDVQLENAIDDWAVPYIAMYERQVALSNLVKTSKIVGEKIEHKK